MLVSDTSSSSTNTLSKKRKRLAVSFWNTIIRRGGNKSSNREIRSQRWGNSSNIRSRIDIRRLSPYYTSARSLPIQYMRSDRRSATRKDRPTSTVFCHYRGRTSILTRSMSGAWCSDIGTNHQNGACAIMACVFKIGRLVLTLTYAVLCSLLLPAGRACKQMLIPKNKLNPER